MHTSNLIQINVAVPARPDEVSWLQIALMCHQVRQQRILGDIENPTGQSVLRWYS